jgi:hypothetical protein
MDNNHQSGYHTTYTGLIRPPKKSYSNATKTWTFIALILITGLILFVSPIPNAIQSEFYIHQLLRCFYAGIAIISLIFLYHYLGKQRLKKKVQRKQSIKNALHIHRQNHGISKEARPIDTSTKIPPSGNKDINQYFDRYDKPNDFFKPSPNTSSRNSNHSVRATGKSYSITYQDFDENITNRIITIKKITRKGRGIYISAYCHLRNEMRTFLRDRIIGYITDIETGEIFEKEDLIQVKTKK